MIKIRCNKQLEAPLITLLKLNDSMYTKGVAGVITEGSLNLVKGMSFGSHALLSHLIDMDVVGTMTTPLKMLNLTVPQGKLTYEKLAELSGGILAVGEEHSGEIGMVTEEVTVTVVIASTTPQQILMEEDIIQFVGNVGSKVLTTVTLPMLPRRISFTSTYDGDQVEIISEQLEPNCLSDLMAQIVIE